MKMERVYLLIFIIPDSDSSIKRARGNQRFSDTNIQTSNLVIMEGLGQNFKE